MLWLVMSIHPFEEPDAEHVQARGEAFRSWRGTTTSPEVVAAVAGVSRPTVYSWETGATVPNLEQLKAMERFRPGLLRALGLVPADDAEPASERHPSGKPPKASKKAG